MCPVFYNTGRLAVFERFAFRTQCGKRVAHLWMTGAIFRSITIEERV